MTDQAKPNFTVEDGLRQIQEHGERLKAQMLQQHRLQVAAALDAQRVIDADRKAQAEKELMENLGSLTDEQLRAVTRSRWGF